MCDGGIMVTASHLPADRNGFKLFTKSGGFTKADIKTLVEEASACAENVYHEKAHFALGPGSYEKVRSL